MSRAPDDAGALDLTWTGLPPVPEFEIGRGTLPDLAPLVYDHACVGTAMGNAGRLLDQVTVDPGDPRSSYYYLVAPSCGALDATAGFASDGTLRPSITGVCP